MKFVATVAAAQPIVWTLSGRDLHDHAEPRPACATDRVLVEVLLRHLVDVRVGAVFGHLRDPSLDAEIAIRILGIDDRQRDARLACEVPRPSRGRLRRVHDDVLPSKSTQTGVTCGLPSGFSVARLAERRFAGRADRRVMRESQPSIVLQELSGASPTTRNRAEWILCRRLMAMASAVTCSIDRARAERADIDRAQPRQHACTSADARDRASSESPQTNSSQSSGCSRSSSRCAGSVLNVPATADVLGHAARGRAPPPTPPAHRPSTSCLPANITGTVTSMTSAPAAKCDSHLVQQRSDRCETER